MEEPCYCWLVLLSHPLPVCWIFWVRERTNQGPFWLSALCFCDNWRPGYRLMKSRLSRYLYKLGALSTESELNSLYFIYWEVGGKINKYLQSYPLALNCFLGTLKNVSPSDASKLIYCSAVLAGVECPTERTTLQFTAIGHDSNWQN